MEHWYDRVTGRGDNTLVHCKCGLSWRWREYLDSHINWKIEELRAGQLKEKSVE